jgi:hypothetical protein
MPGLTVTECRCTAGKCECHTYPFSKAQPIHASAGKAVPQHTLDLLERHGLPVPPPGKRFGLAALDEHLKTVPVEERLLVK